VCVVAPTDARSTHTAAPPLRSDGDKFFTTRPGVEGTLATPLLLALVCVELSDVLFAVDSIPAVFGVTTDPFIALSSNAFALLGLRALYTVVSTAVDDFKYLRPAIAVVLGFIGVKLIGEFAGFEVSTLSSLLLVLGVLGTGVGLSVLESSAEDDESTP
jgi:predicted tellurium resistance membrane protein TerC